MQIQVFDHLGRPEIYASVRWSRWYEEHALVEPHLDIRLEGAYLRVAGKALDTEAVAAAPTLP